MAEIGNRATEQMDFIILKYDFSVHDVYHRRTGDGMYGQVFVTDRILRMVEDKRCKNGRKTNM